MPLHLQNKDNDSIYIPYGLFKKKWDEFILVKWLELCLTHSKCLISVVYNIMIHPIAQEAGLEGLSNLTEIAQPGTKSGGIWTL